MKLTMPRRLRGTVEIPGDKSISHRSVMFNAVAEGNAVITNYLTGADCLSTIACMQALGVEVEREGTTVRVQGRGLRGLQRSRRCARLRQLRHNPAPVDGPTRRTTVSFGANEEMRHYVRVHRHVSSARCGNWVLRIDGRRDGTLAPLAVRGAVLHGGEYTLPVASAQVKSALLLAALSGDGVLRLTGKIASRDHTERMLAAMGIDLKVSRDEIVLHPPSHPVFPISPVIARTGRSFIGGVLVGGGSDPSRRRDHDCWGVLQPNTYRGVGCVTCDGCGHHDIEHPQWKARSQSAM